MCPAWPKTTALLALCWTADCTKSGGSFATSRRCAAGFLPIGSIRQRKSARVAVALPALRAVRKCMSRKDLQSMLCRAHARRQRRNQPQEASRGWCRINARDMTPLPAVLGCRQVSWMNREPNLSPHERTFRKAAPNPTSSRHYLRAARTLLRRLSQTESRG